MSITKRYLESLPAMVAGDTEDKPDWSHDHRCRMCGNQWHCSDAKCGIYFEPMGCGLNGCGGRHDEWTDSAENESTEESEQRRIADMASRALSEWAQALMEDDDEPHDPLVKCRICRKTWPISEMNTNGECPDCQLEEWEQRNAALMIKPEGKCVTLADNNGIEWKL